MWASGYNGEIRRAAHGYEPTRRRLSLLAIRATAGRGRQARTRRRRGPPPLVRKRNEKKRDSFAGGA
jgi:hypothetical protein